MNKDDDVFEYDAPNTVSNLFEMANANDDGADMFFDFIEQKMQGAKSEPNLGIIVKQGSVTDSQDDLEENKENLEPDKFNDHRINVFAHQLIRSASKKRSSMIHNRHSITVEGIELELPRIKHHAMITRLDEMENTPVMNLRTRSVVKSEYKYEHIKSGSKVLKSRSLFTSEFEPSNSSNSTDNIENKQVTIGNECKQIQNNQNVNPSNIQSSAIKVQAKSQKIKVLNSLDGVQVIENKELAHGGIKVLEKQLNTVPKPFSFESRYSCAIKPQNVKDTEQPWIFKARPATVLRKKPFVPKFEKKYTEPKNIRLNTEKRAQEWVVFEKEIKEKFSHYEEISRERAEENKRREIDLIKQMRQKTIHRAEPIKKYKPILIKKSGIPVTVAHGPSFSIRPHKNCSVCE